MLNFPITKDSYLHQSPNHSGFTYLNLLLHQLPIIVGLQIKSHAQRLDHNSPYMSEFENDYIIGLYMKFMSNERYGMYNQDQIPL